MTLKESKSVDIE